jgi:uncharacterized membrane protein YkvA (DUF1232 family)
MAEPTKTATESARRRSSRRRRRLIARTITLLALLPLAGRLPAHARVFAALLLDSRVPAGRKALLGAALGYALAPVDLVPDRFRILGVLDDLVVSALALDAFVAGVPDDVLDEKLRAAGLERAAFDEDLRSVRRLVPRPIRRIVYRIPAAVRFVARVGREAGLDARVRGLFDKEGSPA